MRTGDLSGRYGTLQNAYDAVPVFSSALMEQFSRIMRVFLKQIKRSVRGADYVFGSAGLDA